MPSIAYCRECGRYVQLGEAGACPEGHPRSALRDVRSGTLSDAPAVAGPARLAGVPVSVAVAASQSHPADDEIGIGPKILGWSIVGIPLALLAAFALWTGYEQFAGMGMSPFMRIFYSVASFIATVVVIFVLALKKKRR